MRKIETPPVLVLREVTKSFGQTPVLKGLSLSISEGEFVTFLGSSGCGKTTTLRIVAGLEAPDSGAVLLDGEDVTARPPEKRNVNTVFQSYALFPHLDVAQNIGYGLRLRRVDRQEIRQRVAEMLALVQLEGFEKRRASELSGGQRQRVAIARALINRPKVLLLDEPLGALDLQLRRQMQIELKRLQKQLGTTFVYVTHDQEEAINMSDRIVVMRDGRIEQAGTPAEVYDSPRTAYVARFIGSANILTGVPAGPCLLKNEYGTMRTPPVEGSGQVTLAVRGENIRFFREGGGDAALRARVTEKSYAGGMLRVFLRLGADGSGPELTISRQGINVDLEPGESVFLDWPAATAAVVEPDEEVEP